MARTSIDDEAWAAFETMAELNGWDEDMVAIKIIKFWRRTQALGINEVDRRQLGVFLRFPNEDKFLPNFIDSMCEFGFLERLPRGRFCIKGNAKHISNLKKFKERAKIGGNSRAQTTQRTVDGKFSSKTQDSENIENQSSDSSQLTSSGLTSPILFNSIQYNSIHKEEGIAKSATPPSEAAPLPRFSPKNLAELWNELTKDKLPQVNLDRFSDSPYYNNARLRLQVKPEREYWCSVIERIVASNFCCGENDRGWRADFDFLVRVKSHFKVMEGKYDNRGARGRNMLENLDLSHVFGEDSK